MATFRFLENTPLKFVRTDSYPNGLQTERNRFYSDYWYHDRLFSPYSCTFDQTDNLFFQFRTDYETFDISLISQSGTVTSLTTELVFNYDDETNRKQYNCTVPLTSLNGEYYILISANQALFPIVTFKSECFKIEQNSRLLKLSWTGSESLNDPFVWGEYPACLRLEAEVKRMISGADKSTYLDTDGNHEVTYSMPQNNRLLQIRNIPEYVQKYLDLAIQHDHFYINGVEFGTDQMFEYEAKENLTYSASLKITEKNYWNFTTDEELTGDIPVYDDSFELINDIDLELINDTDYQLINN